MGRLGIRDDTDRQLIALLQTNARQSTTTLAKRLGLARSTVHERICRLEREGVIQGYSVRLGQDPAAGYVTAVAMLQIDQRRQRMVQDRLRLMPEVQLCGTSNGEYDLILLIRTPRLEDLDAVLDELLHCPAVQRCRSSVIMTAIVDKLGRI